MKLSRPSQENLSLLTYAPGKRWLAEVFVNSDGLIGVQNNHAIELCRHLAEQYEITYHSLEPHVSSVIDHLCESAMWWPPVQAQSQLRSRPSHLARILKSISCRLCWQYRAWLWWQIRLFIWSTTQGIWRWHRIFVSIRLIFGIYQLSHEPCDGPQSAVLIDAKWISLNSLVAHCQADCQNWTTIKFAVFISLVIRLL